MADSTAPTRRYVTCDVYWIGGPRWTRVPLVLWSNRRDLAGLRAWWAWFRRARARSRPAWRRRWQAEWEGCGRAVRGWTRPGTRRRAVKAMTR